MARQLPRFQESGLISADVPRMDFANIRESGRFSQSISENLDRISNFAFGQAEKQQKEEQRILGIQLRADTELEVQKVLDDLTGKMTRNEITYEQAQREVQSMQGFARGLAEVDPEQASGLMRSISTSGNLLLRKVSELDTARYVADLEIKSTEAVRSLEKNLETVYSLFATNQVTPEEVLQYEAGARGIITAVAGQTKATVDRFLGANGEFEKARIAARTSALTKYIGSPEFAPDEVTALNRISNNDFGAMAPLASDLTPREVADLKKAVSGEFADRAQAMDRADRQRKAQNNLLFVELYRNYTDPSTPFDVKNQIRQQLFKVADTTEEIEKITNLPSTAADPLLFSNLREMIYRNQITDIKQIQRYSKVLSSGELAQLQTQFMAADKESQSKVFRDISRYAGVPDNQMSIFNPKDAAYVKRESVIGIYETLLQAERDARKNLPPEKITPINFEDLKEKAINQYDSVQKKDSAKQAAVAWLETLSSEKRLKNKITTSTSIDDLRRTKKFTETELLQIQEYINKAKGEL
jgi:hypothetical protein